MSRTRWIALAWFVTSLAGCGGVGSFFETTPVPAAALRGRWDLEVEDSAGCREGRDFDIRVTLELGDASKSGSYEVDQRRSSWTGDIRLGVVTGSVLPGWLGTEVEAFLEFRGYAGGYSVYQGPISTDAWLSPGTLEDGSAAFGEPQFGSKPCVYKAWLRKN